MGVGLLGRGGHELKRLATIPERLLLPLLTQLAPEQGLLLAPAQALVLQNVKGLVQPSPHTLAYNARLGAVQQPVVKR